MKLRILILLFTFLTAIVNAQSIEERYTDMTDAINNQDWTNALLIANQISKEENTFNPSIELIKIKSLHKLADLNEVNDVYFKQLDATISYTLKQTRFTTIQELPLYIEEYEMMYELKNLIEFTKKKRNWLEDALFKQGLAYFKSKNYTDAKSTFEQSANRNNAASYLFLGMIYELSLGVKEDTKKAFDYYTKSYLLGNNDAAYHIGYCHFHGLGVSKDIIQGFNWCEIAAQYNYAPALIELRDRYEKGIATDKAEAKAKYWNERLGNKYIFKYIE